jgi:hypothetical protein
LAEEAVSDLGTAFQIVDDLTDFEFDLARKSHNILVSEAYHSEDSGTRSAIRGLLNGEPLQPGMIGGVFADSARSVLCRARLEGRRAFEKLSHLGFWFPPEHSDDIVRAIVGLDGLPRMRELLCEY